jgi:hypothetical protein
VVRFRSRSVQPWERALEITRLAVPLNLCSGGHGPSRKAATLMSMTRPVLAQALVATFVLTTALHAQSLADVAKKTEEDRAKAKQEQAKSADIKKTEKVYTNKDLPSVGVASIPAAGDADTPTAVSGTTTASADPIVGTVLTIVRTKCAKDWPDDFRMRAFCEKQQIEALQKIAARNDAGTMKTPAGRVIRNKCMQDWRDNFKMANYCEEQQLKAAAQVLRPPS